MRLRQGAVLAPYPAVMDKSKRMTAGRLRRVVTAHRSDIERIARARGALDIRLVGSVARGEETRTSDIDFLVRFAPGRSLFDQAGLIHDLEELLGVDVDVISEGGLRPTDSALQDEAIAL